MSINTNGKPNGKHAPAQLDPEPQSRPTAAALVGITAILVIGFLCGVLATIFAIQPSIAALIARCF